MSWLCACNTRQAEISALIQSTGASNRIEGIFTSDKRLEDHSLLMGKEESKLDEYLKEYEKSEIE